MFGSRIGVALAALLVLLGSALLLYLSHALMAIGEVVRQARVCATITQQIDKFGDCPGRMSDVKNGRVIASNIRPRRWSISSDGRGSSPC
jgi:hypothetical protein